MYIFLSVTARGTLSPLLGLQFLSSVVGAAVVFVFSRITAKVRGVFCGFEFTAGGREVIWNFKKTDENSFLIIFIFQKLTTAP